MTPEQTQIFKDRIVQAVDAHIANGGILLSGCFGFRKTAMCPVSCVIGSPDLQGALSHKLVSNVLGFDVSDEEVWSFIDGFDGNPHTVVGVPELYQFGLELRQKYLNKGPAVNDNARTNTACA
jgi:hypothetical protein